MINKYLKITCLTFLALVSIVYQNQAQSNKEEQQAKVAMRMIGHQFLLHLGDSTSRVLPIEKINNRYKICFERAFEFEPNQLVSIVDQVITKTEIADDYIVEVENCDSNQLVYSYGINNVLPMSMIPCGERAFPKASYSIFLTIWDKPTTLAHQEESDTAYGLSLSRMNTSYAAIALMFLTLISFIGFMVFRKQKRASTKEDPNVIHIGAYQFNKKNLELSHDQQKVELTNKEADLLLLLHESVNTTLERERILELVWGDEGDYVGRTLDVFISKLRKKLEADAQVKIVNIRGVGYKLVI